MTDRETTHPSGWPATGDDEDPYEDVDVKTLPEWWQRNIEEYRTHNLRPYRPPRLADGTLLPPFIEEIEEEHDISIRFLLTSPQENNETDVIIDGEIVLNIPRTRRPEGFTEYELTSDRFVRLIQAEVDQ